VYSTVPIVIAAWAFLFRTSYGLTVRAVGEYPKAVDVAGKSGALYRYSAVLIGGGAGRTRRRLSDACPLQSIC
jgi:general nucleoside transport system permease protein